MYETLISWNPTLRGDRPTEQKKILMSEDTLAGFLAMLSTVFGTSRKFIKIHILNLKDSNLPERLLKRHVLVNRPKIEFDPWNSNWAEFLLTISGRRYEDIGRYSCELRGCFQSSLVQFNDRQFIEGVKIFCNLFGLDYKKHVFLFHDKDDPWRDGLELHQSKTVMIAAR